MLLAIVVLAALASPPEEPASKVGGDLLISCLNHFKKAKLSTQGQRFCACFVVDFSSNITDEQIKAADGIMTERIHTQLTTSGEKCLKTVPPAIAREVWKWLHAE